MTATAAPAHWPQPVVHWHQPRKVVSVCKRTVIIPIPDHQVVPQPLDVPVPSNVAIGGAGSLEEWLA